MKSHFGLLAIRASRAVTFAPPISSGHSGLINLTLSYVRWEINETNRSHIHIITSLKKTPF